jgi:malonyl-CoA/methylmalonyl-CoA synthetase
MIRRILEVLEEKSQQTLFSGLDAEAEIAWERTGGDLLARTGAWQRLLLDRGVCPGDRVGVELPRGPELLPAHLAVMSSGAAVVPVNPALTSVERSRVLERADLRTHLGPSDVPGRGGAITLQESPRESPGLLIFTSGTTGEAKGVPLTQENLEANLAALAACWGLSPSDQLLHVLPAHHVHGLVLALYGSTRLGIPVLLAEKFDADRALVALARHATTVFMGVPTMYHRMARSPIEVDLRHVRVCISGSAPLSPEDFRAFESRFGHHPVERYGLTETMIVATNPLDEERRPGTVGFPLPGVEVSLASDGEIEVRGPSVMGAYWRAPELSRDSFHDGWFRTGDLGQHDERGYLVVAGRKKELILVGGSNVLPGEVERVLAAEPDADEVAVAGLPDADLGEAVVAFVVARTDTDLAALEFRLRARASEQLASYKRPRRYAFLTELPRNPMGKIDRDALRASA